MIYFFFIYIQTRYKISGENPIRRENMCLNHFYVVPKCHKIHQLVHVQFMGTLVSCYNKIKALKKFCFLIL